MYAVPSICTPDTHSTYFASRNTSSPLYTAQTKRLMSWQRHETRDSTDICVSRHDKQKWAINPKTCFCKVSTCFVLYLDRREGGLAVPGCNGDDQSRPSRDDFDVGLAQRDAADGRGMRIQGGGGVGVVAASVIIRIQAGHDAMVDCWLVREVVYATWRNHMI